MVNPTELMHAISLELDRDRVNDDVTVSLLAENQFKPTMARLIAREPGIFSGLTVVTAFASLLEGRAYFQCCVSEGDKINAGQELLTVKAEMGLCLSVERTLINYLSHLSGVATQTGKFVEAVKPHPTQILATRKTLPGLRELQLQAVVAGGGRVHRRNLSDGVLIKENHQIFTDLTQLIDRARQNRSPLHKIEVEVQDFQTLEKILENPPDIIMLDNFSEVELPEAIERIRTGKKSAGCKIEISGGVTLEIVGRLASLGVDYISVGRLTHSSSSLNMSLDF